MLDTVKHWTTAVCWNCAMPSESVYTIVSATRKSKHKPRQDNLSTAGPAVPLHRPRINTNIIDRSLWEISCWGERKRDHAVVGLNTLPKQHYCMVFIVVNHATGRGTWEMCMYTDTTLALRCAKYTPYLLRCRHPPTYIKPHNLSTARTRQPRLHQHQDDSALGGRSNEEEAGSQRIWPGAVEPVKSVLIR